MFAKRTAARSTRELASDFGALVEQGRALLGELAENSQNKVDFRAVMDDMSQKLADFQSSATRAAQQGAKQGAQYVRQADQYVRENPWPTVAAGVILGVIVASLWWSQDRS
jgi:ElaB/YqjD/DUF883 family membrane-anchored ribosome-binding protein